MTKQKHEWAIAGWVPEGSTPTAHEWECKHCGETVDDGDSTASEYCECEHQGGFTIESAHSEGESVYAIVECLDCGERGDIQWTPYVDDVEWR